MSVVTMVLVGLIALLHLYIMWFEMFKWEERGPKVFSQFPAELFKRTNMYKQFLPRLPFSVCI